MLRERMVVYMCVLGKVKEKAPYVAGTTIRCCSSTKTRTWTIHDKHWGYILWGYYARFPVV